MVTFKNGNILKYSHITMYTFCVGFTQTHTHAQRWNSWFHVGREVHGN